jgi:hypothetical protein
VVVVCDALVGDTVKMGGYRAARSETPRNELAPRMPNTGYIQKMRGPLMI